MRIFLDTNFIIDWLFRDEYKLSCKRLLEIGEDRKYEFVISFLSLANLAYIARKQPREVLYRNLSDLCDLFEIEPNDRQDIINAVHLNAADFEDALQYSTAVDSKCDCIISRNAKDFRFSEIPVMTADEFLHTYV